eukprot:3615245-Prorocentrum_lima.AAC.1
MDYRGILVLSALYRAWGKLRLFQLRRWASGWQDGHHFAGFKGVSAEDAWYSLATMVEKAK